MSKSSRENFKARRNAMQREVSNAKKAAGIRYHAGHGNSQAEQGFAQQIALMPRDTRSITALVLGDPIKNDPRRHWCPWLQKGDQDA